MIHVDWPETRINFLPLYNPSVGYIQKEKHEKKMELQHKESCEDEEIRKDDKSMLQQIAI